MNEKTDMTGGDEPHLKQTLSFNSLVLYAMIFMVPIAPFGIYGYVFEISHGMPALTYVVGFIAMAFTALSYSKMMEKFKTSGSVYEYAKRGLGNRMGFIAGWVILLDYFLCPALLYIIAGIAMNDFMPSVPALVWIAGFLALNTVISLIGMQLTSILNYILFAMMMVLLLVFFFLAFKNISNGSVGNGFTITPFYNGDDFSMGTVMASVSLAVLSFLGFDGVATLTAEAKPDVKVSRVPLTALCTITVIFVLQSAFAAWVMPSIEPFKDNLDNAWYIMAETIGGKEMRTACALLTAVSWGLTNSLAAQTAVSRVLYGMSSDGVLPKSLAKLHSKYKTPYIALGFSAVASMILSVIFLHNIDTYALLLNFGGLTAFILLHLSVISYFYMKKQGNNLLTDLICPVLGTLILLYVWISLEKIALFLGMIWILLGVVFYSKYSKKIKNLGDTLQENIS